MPLPGSTVTEPKYNNIFCDRIRSVSDDFLPTLSAVVFDNRIY